MAGTCETPAPASTGRKVSRSSRSVLKMETPFVPRIAFTAWRAPVSSAGPAWVKKKTTTSPRPSALTAGSVLATSGETAGLGVVCGLVAGVAGAASLVSGLLCAGAALCACAGLCCAGVALWAFGLLACGLAAGCVAGFDGVAVCGVGGAVVTTLPVSLAERVARKAAAQSARPRRAMSTGRGRVITPSYRQRRPLGLGMRRYFATGTRAHHVERGIAAGPDREAERA